jgi:hypothetical protein
VQVEHEVPTPEELEVAHAPLQLLTIPKPIAKSIQMKEHKQAVVKIVTAAEYLGEYFTNQHILFLSIRINPRFTAITNKK